MTDTALDAAFQATWPAAEYRMAGGLRVGRGLGGGGRVSAARVAGGWSPADIDAAVAIQRDWGQPPLIAVADDDGALAQALAGRGWAPDRPTLLMEAPVAALAQAELPPVTAFALWPPLAIQRGIWAEQDIGPARQAVMDRVAPPRVAILGRAQDRAAGAAFVAVHGDVAMLHALVVLPRLRRGGLGGWMVGCAARFAAAQGAGRMALAVTRANAPARRMYDRLGFTERGGYAYWSPAGT